MQSTLTLSSKARGTAAVNVYYMKLHTSLEQSALHIFFTKFLIKFLFSYVLRVTYANRCLYEISKLTNIVSEGKSRRKNHKVIVLLSSLWGVRRYLIFYFKKIWNFNFPKN